MENRKLKNQQTKSSSSSEPDESNDRNNNNDKYHKKQLIDDLLQQKKQTATESYQLLNQSIMFRKISPANELHSASNHDFIINLDDKIEKTEKRVTYSMLNSNDVSDDAAYADDNHEYEEDNLEERELNWQKCDYFIAEKDVIKSKKLIKAKKYAKTTTNRKSKTSIGNNRYYFKNNLSKNSKINNKSNANHHKSCLCCYLHEKYSEFITMTANSNNIINSTDINQDIKTNKSNFQSYLFDVEFLNYLKLIEYRHSPDQIQQQTIKNDNSNRVFTNKQNILNKATSFSLSMSNISLNDDDKVNKTMIASSNQPTTHQKQQIVNKSKQLQLKQNHHKNLMSVISSSSMSSISSISDSSSSSASVSSDVDNLNNNGVYHSNQIEKMCNDLLDLNLKLTNDSSKVNQDEKQVLAEDLLQTQTNFFKKIFKIIETFINLNKYLIFKLNNSFTSFDNLTFENLFKFKKFDQLLKQSKPLMDWFIRNNYDEQENNQLKPNDQNSRPNQLDQNSLRRSSSTCSGSKESDGFLILNNNLAKVNNNNINNDENNKTVLSFKQTTQFDLNDANGKHSTGTEVKQQKENEPKFKRSRLNVDMEHSEIYSSNLNLSSIELNEKECEKNNMVLLEEIKRLKKKLNLMCSKDYKIMRRSEYEALKFQLKAFRQDFQLEHNEKVYLRSNYEEKLRALDPCISKINDENFNFVDF